jgi:hypothetical protein
MLGLFYGFQVPSEGFEAKSPGAEKLTLQQASKWAERGGGALDRQQ